MAKNSSGLNMRATSGLAWVAVLAGCSGSDGTNVDAGAQGGYASTGGGPSGGLASIGGGSNWGGAGGIATTGGETGAELIGGNATTGGTAPVGGNAPMGGTKATGGAAPIGGNATTGGTKATGGAVPIGGNAPTGGTKATGGAALTGGASGAGGSTSVSEAATTISNWLNDKSCIPYGNPSGQTRTDIINAIIGACEQFGPPPASNPGWKMEHCWAHLTGSILKESSYNVALVNEPGSDPTVGLTQIRFSSTVCDFYTGGPRARLEAMGCTFPADFAAHASEQCSSAFWKSTGGEAAHTQWMQIPACNVGLGAWYYYTYATGGGDSTTTQYLYSLCNGKAQDANLATGLVSHLRGPSSQWADITGPSAIPSVATDYFNAISKVMDCELGAPNGTNAIYIPLTFNKVQYCK